MNIPSSISDKIGKNLYKEPNHPICILKSKIAASLNKFDLIEDLDPCVTVEDNFDSLLIPKDHTSRSISDTFYKTENHVLRTHMTAYLNFLVNSGYDKFITCGDVYRRDEIDKTHYPVFHQMDGFSLLKENENPAIELRKTLVNILTYLFGVDVKYRFVDSTFPFTIDSCELEVEFCPPDGKPFWMEVLGAGTVHPTIMENLNLKGKKAWAFGIGLERIAMNLFQIPDIRLFWTDDERFSKQFKEGEISKFVPYSKFPHTYKDIAFFIENDYSQNNVFSIIREEAGDLVEEVKLLDVYFNESLKKTSHCYRITYRAISRTLINKDVDLIQNTIRDRLKKELNLNLR